MSDIEQWALNGLALNDATFTLEAISDPPAAKKPEWVSGADSDGALLGGVPNYDNAVIEMTLRVAQQASMDLALVKVGLILDQLQECEQNANGIALVWTPADGTTSVTARAYLGEIVNLPKGWNENSTWLARSPLIILRITRGPFFEGVETLLASVTSSEPLVPLELTGVAGDVPALGRLVVTDAASQSRRYVAWGLESRWYPTTSPPALIVDSASMVTTGYAGVTNAGAGGYPGGINSFITATLRTQVQAIVGLGNLTHVGVFRPQLRFHASATTMALRLTYQTLDGPFRSLSYKIPVVTGWNHVDLGLITIPPTTLGTQRWTGRIEAYSTATGGETFSVDYLGMMPAELFGRARATYAYAPGLLTAYDEFTGRTAGAALGATAAPLGGTWTTSGATTDFAAFDYVFVSTDEAMVRQTGSDSGSGRYAILGTTTFTDVEAELAVAVDGSVSVSPSSFMTGPLARWTDASNHVRAVLRRPGVAMAPPTGYALKVETVVAGVVTELASVPIAGSINTGQSIRLVVAATGVGTATYLTTASGATITSVGFSSSVLATGGALATGKVGFVDYNGAALISPAVVRFYDSFYARTPAAEPIVCYSGQSIEFRHDSALREDSTGVYAGPPPEYVGSRFTIPPAGGPGRKARVAVVARRSDVESTTDDNIADSTTLQIYGTPRYLAVPR